MNNDVYQALLSYVSRKGYGQALMKWNDELANELYGAIRHLVENQPQKPSEQEQFVTIAGVKYKLEEIKK